MSKKTLGILVAVLGVLVLAVSLLADTFGIGTGRGMGLKQIVGTAAGALLAIVGLYYGLKK